MSDYERVKGKVIFIGRLTEEEREAYIKSKYNEYADEPVDEIPEWWDSWFNLFNDDYFDSMKFILMGDALWFVFDIDRDKIIVDYCDITPINEKEYELDTQYYNGVTSWTEMVQDELEGFNV